jgi:hypothetical protein
MNSKFSAGAQIARVDLPKIFCKPNGARPPLVRPRMQSFETIFDEARKRVIHHDGQASLASSNLSRIRPRPQGYASPRPHRLSFSLSSL